MSTYTSVLLCNYVVSPSSFFTWTVFRLWVDILRRDLWNVCIPRCVKTHTQTHTKSTCCNTPRNLHSRNYNTWGRLLDATRRRDSPDTHAYRVITQVNPIGRRRFVSVDRKTWSKIIKRHACVYTYADTVTDPGIPASSSRVFPSTLLSLIYKVYIYNAGVSQFRGYGMIVTRNYTKS